MHARGLTAFLTLSGFVIMTVTGILLYLVPAGRIAYWVDWRFLGLTKTDWGNLHTVSSLLWVVAGCFHLYFNWKVITGYIYNKARGGWRLRKELGLSIVLSVLVIFGSIYLWPPFNYLVDFGNHLKDSWILSPEYEPPFGHAEQLSLKSFAKKTNIELDQAVKMLTNKGMEIGDTGQSLEALARRNGISPMALYAIIKSLEPAEEAVENKKIAYTAESVEELFTGTGLGRKTWSKILGELGFTAGNGRARMKAKGLEINDDETIKQAADRYGVNPMDLLKALLVDDYYLGQ